MILDEPFYSSDEEKDEEEHFIVDESFYYEKNLKGRVTNFLYEPATDHGMQSLGLQKKYPSEQN